MAKSHDFPRIDDLMDRLVLHPESGHIWLDDRRVFMMHAAAYGALRRELIESLGLEVARGLLTRIGYLSGSRDAELAKKIRKTADICEIFAIGPQLHALQGIVQVETVTMDIDVGKGNFYGEFLWRGSVECEAHMIDYGIGPEPVCWMQIGFASGFSSVFMGKPILFRETECRGMGHEACRVVGKPLSDWEDIDDLKFFNAQPFANREVSTHHKEKKPPSLPRNESPPSPQSRFENRRFIGISSAFNATCHMINRVARTTTPVLFLGESGVGKEMFARILHETSDRSDAPFVAVNCAALPESLIEADLFGVEKGAYTGATSTKQGRFERADGGTLLLDEVGCLSKEAQAKLLRVLQEGEFERVGDQKARHVNVRIVAATNEDLEVAVQNGTFRADLYYRLNIFPIQIPPLRDRKDDIPALANYFMQRFSMLHDRKLSGFNELAVEALLEYEWPGNVRELENAIERATLLASPGGAIELANLPSSVTKKSNPQARKSLPINGRTSTPQEDSKEPPLSQIRDSEIALFKEIIEKSRGNLSLAARDLGITRAKLSYRVKKWELEYLCRSRS